VADALVSRERLWYGHLPKVCIKTGEPAAQTVKVSFERTPPWTFLLLLAGVLPFFIAALFVRERITGRLPVTLPVVERYHAHKKRVWLGWGVALLGLVLVIVAESVWLLIVVAAGVLLVVVSEARRTAGWVTGVAVRGTPFVELRRVHPAFAAAVATESEAAG